MSAQHFYSCFINLTRLYRSTAFLYPKERYTFSNIFSQYKAAFEMNANIPQLYRMHKEDDR